MTQIRGFWPSFITSLTFEERYEISKNYLDRSCHGITVLMDATHTPVVIPPRSSYGEYWSYKLKSNGVNTLVYCLINKLMVC